MHDCIHTRTRSSKVQPAEAYCGNGGKFEYNRKILSCDFHLVHFENKVCWVMNSVGWRIIIKKDLDWWHKKEVIEFKVMQKPRAMCMK